VFGFDRHYPPSRVASPRLFHTITEVMSVIVIDIKAVFTGFGGKPGWAYS